MTAYGLYSAALLCDTEATMEKVVSKHDLRDYDEVKDNLEYWLSRPPEERVAAVDFLRAQLFGRSQRFQRVARVLERTRG